LLCFSLSSWVCNFSICRAKRPSQEPYLMSSALNHKKILSPPGTGRGFFSRTKVLALICINLLTLSHQLEAHCGHL
jgi:hypothetical protein